MSTYTITLADAQPKGYEKLHAATAFADKQATLLELEIEVVHAATGVVAYVTSQRAIANREDGVHFVPWTRVETPKHAAPHFEGWHAAYTRRKIEATVYRSNEKVDLPWRVFDGRTGAHQDVATTKAACALTKAMGQGKQL